MPSLETYLISAHDSTKPLLRRQWTQIQERGDVTCPCGQLRAVSMAHKCLYCGVFFCEACAGEHFGESYNEYIDRKRKELFDKLMAKHKGEKDNASDEGREE